MLKKNLNTMVRLFTAAVMLTLLPWNPATAQKQFNNWVFGDEAWLDFNPGTPTETVAPSFSPPNPNPPIYSAEGIATYSTPEGKLRLYTNGKVVYEIEGSTWIPLPTTLKGDNSSTQSGVIVQVPDEHDKFYIFTVDSRFAPHEGMNYYTVDLCDNSVSTANSLIANSSEKIAAVTRTGCSKSEVWVVGYDWTNTEYDIFKSTKNGVFPHDVFEDLKPPTTNFDNLSKVGQMVFSENGKFLASALCGDNIVRLHSFDPQNGDFTAVYDLKIDIGTLVQTNEETKQKSGMVYGVAFSPDNTKLYVSKLGSDVAGASYRFVYQYDLNSILDNPNESDSQDETDLKATERLVYDYHATATPSHIQVWEPASLQLGPDRKIYVAHDIINSSNQDPQIVQDQDKGGAPCIGVIASPNNIHDPNNSTNPSSCDYTVDQFCSPNYDRLNPSNTVQWSRRGLPTLLAPIYCCPEISDPAFQKLTNFEITSNTTFQGHYYIDKDITISGSARVTMDNVVMIFAPGIGINCEENANLVATNSTFKVCDQSTTWKGFEFSDDSYGDFFDNVIINAETGIYVHNNYKMVRISNGNHFINNFHGVEIDFTGLSVPMEEYKGTIADNVFIVDRAAPFNSQTNYSQCEGADYLGILAANVNFAEPISGNHFTFKQAENAKSNFVGVTFNSCTGAISGNYFTDNYYSISVSNSSIFSIENNEMEQTDEARGGNSGYSSLDPGIQIYVFDIEGMGTISGNTIQNRLSGNNNTAIMIGADREGAMPVDNITVMQNLIKGYNRGIGVVHGSNNKVLSNEILDCKESGIYCEDQYYLTIDQNKITLLPDGAGSTTTGIDIRFTNAYSADPHISEDIVITANYIKNAEVALNILRSPPEPLHLPLIRNNAFVEYTQYGIYINNMLGEIGNACTDMEAGKNLFLREPTSPINDIYSSPHMIDEFGNTYNNLSINCFNVNNNCFNQFPTSSAEGVNIVRRVINTSADEITIKNLCSAYNLTFDKQGFAMTDKSYKTLSSLEGEQQVAHANNLLMILSSNKDLTNAKGLYDYTIQNNLLPANDALWFSYKYAFNSEDFKAAEAVLGKINPDTEFDADRLTIERIRTSLQLEHRNLRSLNDNERNRLQYIDDKREGYADVARSILQNADGAHSPIPPTFEDKNIFRTADPRESLIFKNPEQLVVYPNPSAGDVKVYVNLEEYVPTTLTVSDITGRQVSAQDVRLRQGVINLDLSTLDKGTYNISLRSNDGQVVKSVKMIKTE